MSILSVGLERGEAIGLERGEKIGLERGEKIGRERGEAIGKAIGKAIGRVESIIETLEDLGPVPAELREQIESQKNLEILIDWFRKARRAKSIEDFIKAIEDEK